MSAAIRGQSRSIDFAASAFGRHVRLPSSTSLGAVAATSTGMAGGNVTGSHCASSRRPVGVHLVVVVAGDGPCRRATRSSSRSRRRDSIRPRTPVLGQTLDSRISVLTRRSSDGRASRRGGTARPCSCAPRRTDRPSSSRPRREGVDVEAGVHEAPAPGDRCAATCGIDNRGFGRRTMSASTRLGCSDRQMTSVSNRSDAMSAGRGTSSCRRRVTSRDPCRAGRRVAQPFDGTGCDCGARRR